MLNVIIVGIIFVVKNSYTLYYIHARMRMKRFMTMMLAAVVSMACYSQTTELKGLRMGVFGDSYVRNHKEPFENTWHYKFAKKYGMEYQNYGRNGSCVALDRQRFGKAMWKRVDELPQELDLLVIIAGHNDAVLLDSIGMERYEDRLDTLCIMLTERYPEARIAWFTPWCNDNPNFENIVDATIKVCGRHGIPVFDAMRNSNIYARNDKFRDIYFQSGHTDHAHLNSKGHDRFLPLAEHFLLSLF